jgi:type IV pilus assembly protein PilC
VALVAGVVLARRTPGGRYTLDRLLLRIPVLGSAIQYTMVERFCRVLASMVSAGVALPTALRVATHSLRNAVFTRSLTGVTGAVLQGDGLAAPLAATELFPGTASRMIRVGEDTGTLETQLEVTARYYEGELEYKIKKLTSMFEPLMIIVMGGTVGFVAVALISAMYGIFHQVQI